MFKGYFTQKKNIAAAVMALIHWVITFFSDRLVFDALPWSGELAADECVNYFLCKVVLLVVLCYMWKLIIGLAADVSGLVSQLRDSSDGIVRSIDGLSPRLQTAVYAAVYFLPIIGVLIFKLPQGFLSNDETLIFAEAAALHSYTWFYYLTTYYYIVTMMLIPCWLGPILVKVFIQLAVCGYCVYRLRKFLKDRYAYGIYLAFLLPPVLAYTTSAHRIPVYYLLYLLLFFTLAMDRLEKAEPSGHRLFWIMVCGAVLTQWRTEGVYMAVLLPILIFLTYPSLFTNKKKILTVIAASLVIQYLMTVPQTGFVADRLGDQADNRMGPFWAYTVTNMYRNGLDLEKNSADMEKIWRYLDKGTLQAINDDLRNINYEDVLILYYPGYTGRIETATDADYIAYVEGCKSLFVHNPGVLLKTRIGAFCYAAMPYHFDLTEGGMKGFLKFLVSVVKTCAYNLFIPLAIAIFFWIYSLVRRRWQYFFMLSGLACHFVIVFILAPASYFKYYFPIYMLAYFGLIYAVLKVLRERRMAQRSED